MASERPDGDGTRAPPAPWDESYQSARRVPGREPPGASGCGGPPVGRHAGGVYGGDGRGYTGDGPEDLRVGQFARDVVLLGSLGGVRDAGRLYGGGRDRDQARQVPVADPSGVHDLGEDRAARRVHGVGQGAPGGHLLVAVQAGGREVALADPAGLGALGGDQRGRPGPLHVVVDHGVGGQSALDGRAVARHGRHEDPVGDPGFPDGDGLERCGHLRSVLVRWRMRHP